MITAGPANGVDLEAAMAADLAATLANRENLQRNANLLYWYRRLYDQVFGGCSAGYMASVLEIGSGVSPLKRIFPDVITSDILPLSHVDLVFDCHKIDEVSAISDASLEAITCTNVIHHLQRPTEFLVKAAAKLKPGGKILAVEPYFSWLSTPIFRWLHHEPCDFTIERPELASPGGPLSMSNQALAHMLFLTQPQWLEPLRELYDVKDMRISHFTGLSYMASGGISRKLPIPAGLYRAGFAIDHFLARKWPKVFASFFIVEMTRKGMA